MLVAAVAALALGTSPWEAEVVYQIFPRSFADSNGDGIGDFGGIRRRLGYLKELGVTAILINPIQSSRTYHNYFADDFFRADPEFGTNDEFFDLCRAARARGLKVLLDMEPQYVTEAHPWWNQDGKTWKSGSWLYDLDLRWFDGQKIRIAAINPTHPVVQQQVSRAFLYWLAPPNRPKDGVDGFRIDHMMDDLDSKGKYPGLLKSFWRPIVDQVRVHKPSAFFVGEQALWDFGDDLFRLADVDAVFAIPFRGVVSTFDAAKVATVVRRPVPAGKTQMIFVESHDTQRWASLVGNDPARIRLGAFLTLFVKGTPTLYYGQELGLPGTQGNWGSDGNDIPVRLAMRWERSLDAPGTTRWYRGTGPWAELGLEQSGDGRSVEEQRGKRTSVLETYRRLIQIRQRYRALRTGGQEVLTSDDGVFRWRRTAGKERFLLSANLTDRSIDGIEPWGYRIVRER